VRFAAAGAGAVAAWAFLVNRTVLNWPDGALKTGTLLALAVALGAIGVVSAAWPRAGRRDIALSAWLALLGVFGAGEAHRVWLRASYGATSFDAPLFEPVTTTALEVRRFTRVHAPLGDARIRVVALSDLHVTGSTDWTYVARVHARVRELAPDFVLFTGDYVAKPERLPLLVRWLDGMPQGRLGSYAVLGNHDYWTGNAGEIRAAIERGGVRVLAGACVDTVVADARTVRLCGTEAPWGPALAPGFARNGADTTLVLSHTPDNVYSLAAEGTAAVFAGHTHGGQWRIPWLGPLVIPSQYGRRFDLGRFEIDGAHLFVSAGVGADAPNLRLWCPPDVVVVELAGR
jgi:predicted MPP superfamily phosphohydrolase